MNAGPGLAQLRRLARAAPRTAPAPPIGSIERCDLCSEPVPPTHRHLLDLARRHLRCACRACALLFDRREAGGGQYRLVPERCRELPDLALDDPSWERLGIPVATAFFFRSTPAGRIVAFYPSPMGAMESRLDLGAWEAIADANPVLGAMEPDVEALLVHRARGAREHWLVPIDASYRLVAIIRMHWKGFGGGERVWSEIARFFETLHEKEGACRSRTT